MIRRLIPGTFALCLLLCVATVVLWVSSYWTSESLMVGWHSTTVGLERWTDLRIISAGGVIHLVRWTKSQSTEPSAAVSVGSNPVSMRIGPGTTIVISFKDVAGPEK